MNRYSKIKILQVLGVFNLVLAMLVLNFKEPNVHEIIGVLWLIISIVLMILPAILFKMAMDELSIIKKENSLEPNIYVKSIFNNFLILSYIVFVVLLFVLG